MLQMRPALGILSSLLIALAAGSVFGQDYPNRPIRIFTAGAGGAGDFTSRLIAQLISGPLGQPLVVENRPGVIADETVSKTPPDGYTLLVHGDAMWIMPLLQKVNYDPIGDFSPISLLNTYPNVVVVHPSLPVHSVKELIALARARPGQLNYASSAIGGTTHLATELLKSMTDVNIVLVPYKSVGQALTSMLAGETQLFISDVGSTLPYVKTGRLRALAVTSAQPSALTPELPTVAASGLPGYEMGNNTGLFAPAKTAPAIIARLNQEVVRALSQTDVKQKFFSSGLEAVSSSPERLAVVVKGGITTLGKVIKDANIRIQ